MDKEGLLQGKLALVTGAGQGNGRALALDVTDAEACAPPPPTCSGMPGRSTCWSTTPAS